MKGSGIVTIRANLEANEKQTLSPFASLSSESRGRVRPLQSDDVRTEYMRDRDRILHSKAFRRLKDKTQVFLSPQGDHYRTRLVHTLEVSQLSRTVAKALKLNEDLVEAIALGHDLGHTPFGHAGERALNKLSPYEIGRARRSSDLLCWLNFLFYDELCNNTNLKNPKQAWKTPAKNVAVKAR